MASIRSSRHGLRARSSRSSRSVLLVACLAVAGLLPSTASAEVERGWIVVEGIGGSTTEWELDADLAIEMDGNRPYVLTGGGEYAGALLEPVLRRTSPVGAVQVRAFADETREAVARIGFRLESGRYRVTLFGNGPVRVALPHRDREAEGIRIVTRKRLPVSFLGRSEALDAGYGSSRIDLAGALPAGRRALLLNLETGTRVGRFQSCATAGDECEEPLLPFCPPSPGTCDGPVTRGAQPSLSAGDPRAGAGLIRPEPVDRRLLWSFEGYRDSPGKLRAAAIVF